MAASRPPSSVALPALASPRVSIVVNNYNYGRFVEQALESARAQTYPCELIVIDDGSTDDSRARLARWADRVTVVLQENGGQYSAYNAGFAESSGELVVFLDADDWLYPDAIERAVAAFAEGVVKVHFRLELVDERGTRLGSKIPSTLAHGDVASRMLNRGILYASAPGSGNVYRRAALERLFPLPEPDGDRVGADFFTIFGVALFGRVAGLADPAGAYRVHAPADRRAYVFGNAAQAHDERARVLGRMELFRDWVKERAGIVVPTLTDFSQLKTEFVSTTVERAYLGRLRAGARAMPGLLRALWWHGEFSFLKKLGLSAWSLLVTCAPGPVARPVARYVTNPGSR